MESILALSVSQNASDLHLSSGEKAIIRQNGQLVKISDAILRVENLERYLLSLLNKGQIEQLRENKQVDFAYHHSQFGRFRVNVFYQQKGISAVFRLINATSLSLNDIQAPSIIEKLILKRQGLILVTGATGSGKSTTLSAMINHLNQHTTKHIITLEDPIEFLYQNRNCLIQQREIGEHSHSFIEALNAILRQDPDVIMIGEMRDKETIQAALRAAETGHLVLATLHTNSAIQTVNRIIEEFSEEARGFVRSQLAHSLQAIISQRLVIDTKTEQDNLSRKAIFEILINIPAVSHLIEEGKIKQLISMMQTGQQYGMQLMPEE